MAHQKKELQPRSLSFLQRGELTRDEAVLHMLGVANKAGESW